MTFNKSVDRIQGSIVYPDSSQELLNFNPHVTVTVGRDPSCTIVIHDPAVSRHHLYVQFFDDCVCIRDNSKNGTWIDNKLLLQKSHKLRQQQAIRIAGHLLTFYWPLPT